MLMLLSQETKEIWFVKKKNCEDCLEQPFLSPPLQTITFHFLHTKFF
jgi:hypothetical protein